jgi:hypothetical protein
MIVQARPPSVSAVAAGSGGPLLLMLNDRRHPIRTKRVWTGDRVGEEIIRAVVSERNNC